MSPKGKKPKKTKPAGPTFRTELKRRADEHRAHELRVTGGRHGGGPDDVREEDGDELSLLWHGASLGGHLPHRAIG